MTQLLYQRGAGQQDQEVCNDSGATWIDPDDDVSHQDQEVCDDPGATWIDPDNDVKGFGVSLKDEFIEVQVGVSNQAACESHVNPMRTDIGKPYDC